MRRLLLLVPSRPDPLFRGGIKGGGTHARAGLQTARFYGAGFLQTPSLEGELKGVSRLPVLYTCIHWRAGIPKTPFLLLACPVCLHTWACRRRRGTESAATRPSELNSHQSVMNTLVFIPGGVED